jgi:hypothetical protein
MLDLTWCSIAYIVKKDFVTTNNTKGLQMNFEITGKLLERTTALARDLQCGSWDIMSEIYRKGLDAMESDRPPRPTQRADITEVLTEEERNRILSSPESSDYALSIALLKPVSVIRRYRLVLAEKHIREHFDDSDLISAPKFGLSVIAYKRLRIRLGFLHSRVCAVNNKKIEPSDLGTSDEIRYALTEGGQTISDIIRDKGLPISRERARQIILEYGLTGKADQRRPIWYARRLVGKDRDELAINLANKDWVAEQVAGSGRVSALAAKLAITETRLECYLRKHLDRVGLKPLNSWATLVELKCSHCGGSIWRRKSLVESEKKRYPERTKHFCNKMCQGKWLGSLRKNRSGGG